MDNKSLPLPSTAEQQALLQDDLSARQIFSKGVGTKVPIGHKWVKLPSFNIIPNKRSVLLLVEFSVWEV